MERLERGTDTSRVWILTIGIGKPRAGIDKGPLHLGYRGEAVERFLQLPLSSQAKRKFLWDSCARLYGFDT